MTSSEQSNIETLETDIVMIGGGGVGLSAAIASREKGARVILLEKRHALGGNAAIAGGIFAAQSHLQKKMKIVAQIETMFKMAMDYSHWKIDPAIFLAFLKKSGETIRWLEEMGLEFEGIPNFLPNQIRVFHLPQGHGAGLVRVLARRCEELGVRSLSETAALRIVKSEKGNVVGVSAVSKGKELNISAKAVIIGTGGYAGNKEFLKKHYPDYTEDLHSVGIPHTGDGISMALEIGAAPEGLGILQLRGPYFRGSLELTTVAMEPYVVWVNKAGERFYDESCSFNWPEAGNALRRQPDKICYSLLDDQLIQFFVQDGIVKGYSRFPAGTRMTDLELKLRQESEKGTVKISSSWEKIAKWIGASPKVLQTAVNDYNRFCDQGHDEMFVKERRFLAPLRKPPFYALRCHQSFLGTLGGIKINSRMEVLDRQDHPIPGLYAGGNDVGGWESDTYCLMLSGSAFAFAINSGRIAAENAAEYVSGK